MITYIFTSIQSRRERVMASDKPREFKNVSDVIYACDWLDQRESNKGMHLIEKKALDKAKALLSKHVTLSRLNEKDRAEVIEFLKD